MVPAPAALILMELLLFVKKLHPVMSIILAPDATIVLVLNIRLLPTKRTLAPPVAVIPVSMTFNKVPTIDTRDDDPVTNIPAFAGVSVLTEPVNAEFLIMLRILVIESPVPLFRNCTASHKIIGTPAELLRDTPV